MTIIEAKSLLTTSAEVCSRADTMRNELLRALSSEIFLWSRAVVCRMSSWFDQKRRDVACSFGKAGLVLTIAVLAFHQMMTAVTTPSTTKGVVSAPTEIVRAAAPGKVVIAAVR